MDDESLKDGHDIACHKFQSDDILNHDDQYRCTGTTCRRP
jgi:hypothetical protein